jgi:hypothetical protein
LLADPNMLVMFVDCGAYDLPTATLPVGCDWFDTPPRPAALSPTFTIQSVFPALQLIALVFCFGWLVRRGRRAGPLGVMAAAAGVLGSALLLVASVEQLYSLAAPGIALLGIGWFGASRLVASRSLAALSLVLGTVAISEAVDSGVLLLPSPIGPVWIRLLLEVVWIVWIIASLVKTTRATVKVA